MSNSPSSSTSLAVAVATTAGVVLALDHIVVPMIRQRMATQKRPPHFDIPQELDNPDDNPYWKECKLAISLALQAGAIMEPFVDTKGAVGVETKLEMDTKSSPDDLVTVVDRQNEQVIFQAIRQAFPNHQLIGEEATGTGELPTLGTEPTWIVDPVDGTTNFASGFPMSCVSIGLCDKGEPVMGVVYAPSTRELYVAVRGHGAYRNGRRIRSTTTTTATRPNLRNAIVCFEFGYARSPASVHAMVHAVRQIVLHGCRTTRTSGSGVLNLCYVACGGRFTVVYTGVADEGWKPWDYCAAMVVAEEAGCTIRSWRPHDLPPATASGRFNIYAKSMICGVNETVVKELEALLLENHKA